MPAVQTDVLRLPEALAKSGTIELSPFDVANAGRSIPLVWFYKETLDTPGLLESLRHTLCDYPVFCGRYAPPATAAVAVLPLQRDRRSSRRGPPARAAV